MPISKCLQRWSSVRGYATPRKKKVEGLGRAGTNLKMGIVGMPNVGKSSFFNALTNSSVAAENYPFCTIDPTTARTALPDTRYDHLLNIHKPKTCVPSYLTTTDIAGLVRGAHEGHGLGNSFLAHIQAVDGLFHLVRGFGGDVLHVEGNVDPVRDVEIIREELRKRDVGVLERESGRKRGDVGVLERVLEWVKGGEEVRMGVWDEEQVEVINTLGLLTAKPVVYLCNTSPESYIRKQNPYLPHLKATLPYDTLIPYSGTLETTLASLQPAERATYLHDMETKYDAPGPVVSALPGIIWAGYKALGLVNSSETEVRSWTIRQGTRAPQAAAVIHTDFEKSFAGVDVTPFERVLHQGVTAKAVQRGRDYEVEDGDVVYYSKWDKLELSDDEDFECHPNVDKASMVRWRQSEIHRQRHLRKVKLECLAHETRINCKVQSALEEFLVDSHLLEKLQGFVGVVEDWDKELEKEYRRRVELDWDARWGAVQGDAFVEARIGFRELLSGVLEGLEGGGDVVRVVGGAVGRIRERQQLVDDVVRREEEEAKKKLTVDDLKEGFNKTVLSKNSEKPNEKQTVIETIHAPGNGAGSGHVASPPPPPPEDDDEEADRITYPPAETFSKLVTMESSFAFLLQNPTLVSQRYSDMILAEAFRKQMDGQDKEARQCVQQALLLQYCALLGADGVRLFFTRLSSPNHTASTMFHKDVLETYTRIQMRVRTLLAEQSATQAAERAALEQRLASCTRPDGTYFLSMSVDASEAELERARVFGELAPEFQKALLLQDVDLINGFLTSVGREEGERVVRLCSGVGLLDLEEEEEED
ncbi:threonine---tRNA ligase [Spizellomyces sp. 'palustris']|nr:threonine---tRNA ligase [Spizellomyces sp. 'palustris']